MSQIIAFPARPAISSDHARLQTALVRLLAALDAQKAAVAQWRGALGELRQSVTELDNNMACYRRTLTGLASGVNHLTQQAHSLSRTADGIG